MINCKNQEQIKEQIKSCEGTINETITHLSSEGEIDSQLFRDLLIAKESLDGYWKRKELGLERWN